MIRNYDRDFKFEFIFDIIKHLYDYATIGHNMEEYHRLCNEYNNDRNELRIIHDDYLLDAMSSGQMEKANELYRKYENICKDIINEPDEL